MGELSMLPTLPNVEVREGESVGLPIFDKRFLSYAFDDCL